MYVPQSEELKIVCKDGQATVEKRIEISGHQLITIQGLCKGYVERFILQGKIEFASRSAGYVLRQVVYERMLVSPGTIITKSEILEFEKAIRDNKIPKNLRIKDMWQNFEHYQSSSFWTDLLKYGAIAVGVCMVVTMIYLGINHFCPSVLKKQGRGQKGGSGADNINISIGGGVGNRSGVSTSPSGEEEPGTEMQLLSRSERSTSMSVHQSLIQSPSISRKLRVSNMSKDEKRNICESADIIRAAEGFKSYDTQTESEGEDDSDPKVTFSVKTCPKCKYVMGKCQCTICKNCGLPYPELCKCEISVLGT